MKVSGTASLAAPRDDVWRALNDPAVLARAIPGCQRLDAVGADQYRMTLAAGVASLKGVYEGEVRLTDQRPPEAFVLRAAGAGAPGTVTADVAVTLREDGPRATLLSYDADAVVGGVLGGVGQRLLVGVARRSAEEFFGAVDAVLAGAAAPDVPVSAAPTGVAPAAAPAPAWRASPGGFVPGVVVGAAAALAGVVIGGWLTRRAR